MAGGTVVDKLYAEIDADTVRLEAALASSNKRIDALEAKLAGLKASAAESGAALDNMGVQVGTGMDKITLTIGAVGAAVLALGVMAEEAGAKMDGSLRQIGAAAPALRTNLRGVRDDIEGVATESGRSRDEIFAASEEITRLGVASEAEFNSKLKAATLISDATGTALSSSVDGVDQLTDAFDVSTDTIVADVAKIFSAAKGRVDFESVFGAFKAAAPQIQKLGIDFDTAVRATVALLDRGLTAKKVGAFFNDHDADGIRAVANEAKIATGAMQDFQNAADFRRGGADRDIQRQLNTMNAAFADLGTVILPAVTRELSGIAGLVTTISGGLNKLRSAEFLATATTLGQNAKGIQPLSPEHVRFGEALNGLNQNVKGGSLDVGSLSPAEVKNLRDAVDAFMRISQSYRPGDTSIASRLTEQYAPLIAALDQATAKQKAFNTAAGTDATSTSGGGGGSRGALPLTVAELQAQAEARKAFAEATAAQTPGKGDDVNTKIAGLIEQAQKAKLSLGEIVSSVDALRAAASKTAEQQSRDLEAELQVALQGFQSGQADSYLAANDKLVEQLRKKLALNTELGAVERDRQSKEIDAIDTEGKSMAATLKLFDQLQLADTNAARARADYANQTGVLDERERQLQDVINTSTTSTAKRTAAETELKALEADRLALSQQQIAADVEEARRVGDEILALQRRAEAAKTPKEEEEIQKRIADYKQKIADLEKEIAALRGTSAKIAKDDEATAEKARQHAQQMATLIDQGVGGALEMARAFGLLSDRSAQALQNIGRIASSIASVKGATNFAEAFPGYLGIAGGAVGLLSSMFGESPEEKQAKQALEANTLALRDLTHQAKTSGLLGSSVTQSDAAQVQSILTPALFQVLSHLPATSTPNLKNYGLSDEQIAELKRAAEALGLTWDGTIGTLEALTAAVGEASPVFGKFGSDFSSMMAEIDAESKVFGDQGPLVDLQKVLTKIGGLSPAVKDLFAGIDTSKALTPDEIETLRKRIEGALQAMEGSGVTNLGGINGEDFEQVLEKLIEDLNNLTPAVQSAEDKLSAAIDSMSNDLAIHDITDPTAVFQKKAQTYAGNIGGSLGDLLKGFDLSNTDPDNIAKIDKALQDLFDKLKTSPDSVDTAGLSIDELIKVLLDLHSAADNVAAGVQSAVDKMNAARQQLDTDFQVFNETDPAKLAQDVANFYANADKRIADALAGSDLSTAEGRASADKALQALYAANKDDAVLSKAILDILQHLRAVPVAGAAGSGAAGGGASSAAAAGGTGTSFGELPTFTVDQADRLIGLFTAMLAQVREFQLAVSDRLDAMLTAISATIVSAPQIPIGFGAFAGAASVTIQVSAEMNFYGPVGQTDEAAAGDLSRNTVDFLEEELARRLKNRQLLLGNSTQS